MLGAGCSTEPDVLFPFGETVASTTDPGITTVGGTFDPTNPTESGQGSGQASGDTTAGMVDTTAGEGSTTSTTDTPGSTGPEVTSSTTDEPGTTEGSTTDEPGTTSTGMMGGSTSTGMGGGSTSTGMGGGSTSTGMGGGSTSTGMVCNDVPGNYEDCLDDAAVVDTTPCAAPGAATCLTAGGPPATVGVCSIGGCLDDCDCPEAPPTGTAPVTCSDVTGDPANLFCNLDCSAGDTCPTDMVCFGGFICLWPNAGAEGEPYGDCFNNPTDICGVEGICLNDDVAAPTIGVCTTDCPGGVGDCPPSPGGTAPVACADLTGDGASECFLDCFLGVCPVGMTCFADICVWD